MKLIRGNKGYLSVVIVVKECIWLMGRMEENIVTQKLGTTFVLLIFLLLAFALLSAFSSYFENFAMQSTNLNALQGGIGF